MKAEVVIEPRLDLVVLGVGPEGHLCSLFPEHPLLRERNGAAARVTVLIDADAASGLGCQRHPA